MTEKQLDKYSADNIMRYRTAVAAIDNLVKQGLLSAKDKAKMCSILNKKYSINSCSIFAA